VIEDAASRYEIAEIAFDEWNAHETATKLGEKGLTMVEHRQGFGSMSEPSKDYEAKVIAGRIGHLTPRGAHPVTRWMMSNVAIRHDPADNIKPDKSQAKGRIDGVVASIMAVGPREHRAGSAGVGCRGFRSSWSVTTNMSKLPMESRPLRLSPEVARVVETALAPSRARTSRRRRPPCSRSTNPASR
jgi:hypothetical protein